MVTVEVHIHDDSGDLPEALAALARIETQMAELQQALTDLQAAVAAVAQRVADGFGPLQEALTAAQQALTDFQAEDATEDAAYQANVDTLTTSLGEALATAAAAADTIEASVAELNQVAAPPEV